MKTLNRMKEFGKIAPPWVGEGFDRPACYQQGDDFFDAHDRQIIPGQPLKAAEIEPEEVVEDGTVPTSVAELAAQVDTMSWPKWSAAVKNVLGPACPRGKAAMLGALQEAIKEHGERQSNRTAKTAAPAPTNGKSGIDLAAWARGQKDYISGEVFKAMRTAYNVQFSERRDAVDFLISEGVIEAAQARKDV